MGSYICDAVLLVRIKDPSFSETIKLANLGDLQNVKTRVFGKDMVSEKVAGECLLQKCKSVGLVKQGLLAELTIYNFGTNGTPTWTK